jgi:hypothetical protein
MRQNGHERLNGAEGGRDDGVRGRSEEDEREDGEENGSGIGSKDRV